jgi:hypothetical protein
MRSTDCLHHTAAPAFVAALLALTAAAAAGQRVTGTVTDGVTGEPVGLAVVALVDSAGTVLQHVLTSTGGAFIINVTGSGPFRLRVDRIGYQPVDSAPFRVEPGTEHFFPLRIDARPIAIAAIRASGEQTCAINASAGEVLRVWTETRKALIAAAAAERQRVFLFSGYVYTRRVDTDGLIRSQTDRPFTNTWRQPFTGRPAGDLIGSGYVRTDEGGITYYAPSADVLLSREFEEVNCFSLRRSRDQPGLIGVSFEPNRRYRLPAVAGTAWLDARTLHLQLVEFSYVNVASIPFAEHASGRVEFRMLPNGGWLINRWSIRMPSAVQQTRAGNIGASSISVFTEQGGEVHGAVAGGQRYTIGATGTIAGSLVDSTTARPLADAVVTLGSVTLTDRTDEDGRFRIIDVPHGRYAVRFDHPRLDSLPAYHTPPLVVDVRATDTTVVELAIPPLARSELAECGTRRGRTAVYGMIRDAVTLEPLSEARLTLAWDSVIVNAAAIGSARRGRDIRTGSDGRYFTCDVPFDHHIEATIEIDGRVLQRTEFWTITSPTFRAFEIDTGNGVARTSHRQEHSQEHRQERSRVNRRPSRGFR